MFCKVFQIFNIIFLNILMVFTRKSYFCKSNLKKMKKIITLFLASAALISCQEDLKFSNPGFQVLKDDVLWKANDARAYVSESGRLRIEGMTEYETVTLNTSSTNVGTYLLGTTNVNNMASYVSSFEGVEVAYSTAAAPGPVAAVALFNGGTGYVSSTNVATTGGTGSGLTVTTTVDATGKVTAITVVSRGNGYVAGDTVTITGGNLNAKFKVTNVMNSNGEIKITKFDNVKMTITGKFKFNATKVGSGPFGGEVVNYQYGDFYNIPIYPNP